jgi:hypothetical protein
MSYGPARPDCANGAAWLQQFMNEHGLSTEAVSHIVGVNQARIWEWSKQRRPLPDEAREHLERWAADGCPRFDYWVPGALGATHQPNR